MLQKLFHKISRVHGMITIFCDFRLFPAKKWRFSKNHSYDQIFAKILANAHIFTKIFGENI
jgi:hypothetical protein